MSVALGIGSRLQIYCTSMGRVAVLRSILTEVRHNGYALVDRELEIGLRSIAVPIRNQSGRVLAAMNISGHASRISNKEMRQRFLSPLLYAVEGIRMALA